MNTKAKVHALIVLSLLLLFCGLAWADESDLLWSTYLGGSGYDQCSNIVVSSVGCSYVTGQTTSSDFPVTAGAFDGTLNEVGVFVAKLNPAGTALEYATFLEGGRWDNSYGIAADDSGKAYVTGMTSSPDFPTTAGAFDTTYNGSFETFVAKLDATGNALVYATFLGGSDDYVAWDICGGSAVDDSGNAYVSGLTTSDDFPTTPGAFDTTYNGQEDVFVAKLNPAGTALEYATLLGSRNTDISLGIAVDGSGNAYVTGWTSAADFPTTTGAFDTTYNGEDGFVVKLNPMGSALTYSTFLGGSSYEMSRGIAVDNSGNAYVTGFTYSDDFPVTAGAFNETLNGVGDAYVAKLNPTGSALSYSTFLGGNDGDGGWGIAVDGSGNAYVTGITTSDDFPTTAGAFNTIYSYYDAFVAKLNPTGSILDYATFLGGSDQDDCYGIALDGSGNVYVSGVTYSDDFPTTSGAFDTTYNGQEDVFVAKLALGGTTVESEPPEAWLPTTITVHQNFPNPFNASTEIRYRIPEDGRVTLKVFNTLGQEVRTIVDADQETGWHAATWDGRDNVGQEVASGLYFCRMRAGGLSETVKMALLR